jgi:hypothetical protein
VHLVVPAGGSFRETRRIELGPRVLTIGRAAACDVRVDVPGVDDEHAKISEIALIAIGPDCAVGDVPLDAGQRRLVMPGDEIQIGSVVLALAGPEPHAIGGRHAPRVRVVEGQNFGDELVLTAENQEYVIGRSPKADLVLEDREVSREHIKLVRRGFNVFIFDAASTRGSWLGRSAVYQGSRVEWQRPRMLKLGATVLSLDLPEEALAWTPGAQASAPMTAPPRARPAEQPQAVHHLRVAQEEGPPANVVAYHYEARPQAELGATPTHEMPPVVPTVQGIPPHATQGMPPHVGMPAYAMQGIPPHAGMPPHAMPAKHHSSPPPGVMPGPHPMMPSAPPAAAHSPQGGRTAWKKTGPTIGRASGILLLALAGIAILGVLFVVFSLME